MRPLTRRRFSPRRYCGVLRACGLWSPNAVNTVKYRVHQAGNDLLLVTGKTGGQEIKTFQPPGHVLQGAACGARTDTEMAVA